MSTFLTEVRNEGASVLKCPTSFNTDADASEFSRSRWTLKGEEALMWKPTFDPGNDSDASMERVAARLYLERGEKKKKKREKRRNSD